MSSGQTNLPQNTQEEQKHEEKEIPIHQSKYHIDLEPDQDKNNVGQNLKRILIQRNGQTSQETFDLFYTKKGKNIIYQNILEVSAETHQKDNITIHALSSSIYIAIQALTELQYDGKLKITKTDNLTSTDAQEVVITVSLTS